MNPRPAPAWHWPGPLSREQRDTLLLMFATLLTAGTHAGHLNWPTLAGFSALFGWRLTLVLRGRALPGRSLRIAAAAACAATVHAQFGTLIGREAGVSLLVLLLGLKLMELRARRDLFVVILLCCFLLLTRFFASQSAGAAALVTVALLVLVCAMTTMHYGTLEPPLRQRFLASARLLAQSLPLAMLLFLLFPRVQGPLWRLPADAGRGVTGLSDSMSPGQIAMLASSDAIAFRVKFDDPPPPRMRMYWRGPVLGHFDGRTWRPSVRRPAQPPTATPEGDPASALRYTVTLEPGDRAWLFALEAPIRIILAPDGGVTLTHEMLLLARERAGQRLRYTLESRLDYRLDHQPDAGGDPALLRAWTQLPPDTAPRTRALAAEWLAAGDTPAQAAQRFLNRVGEPPFRYTLSPPIPIGDPVDGFLFDTRAGFCEHYASAFVVLMRAMRIPARVVTGYLGGERNPVDDVWTVRQADAHAWAEIWLAGRGWVRIDPTAAIAPERIDTTAPGRLDDDVRFANAGWLGRLRFDIDALDNAWNQWLLGYDKVRQARLLDAIGLDGEDWRQLAGVLAGGLALAIGALALLTLRAPATIDPLARDWRRFRRRLASAGLPNGPADSGRQLLARADGVLDPAAIAQAGEIVALHDALRYAPPQADHRARVRHFRQLVDAFKP